MENKDTGANSARKCLDQMIEHKQLSSNIFGNDMSLVNKLSESLQNISIKTEGRPNHF
jgi:hypothetical protein